MAPTACQMSTTWANNQGTIRHTWGSHSHFESCNLLICQFQWQCILVWPRYVHFFSSCHFVKANPPIMFLGMLIWIPSIKKSPQYGNSKGYFEGYPISIWILVPFTCCCYASWHLIKAPCVGFCQIYNLNTSISKLFAVLQIMIYFEILDTAWTLIPVFIYMYM